MSFPHPDWLKQRRDRIPVRVWEPIPTTAFPLQRVFTDRVRAALLDVWGVVAVSVVVAVRSPHAV